MKLPYVDFRTLLSTSLRNVSIKEISFFFLLNDWNWTVLSISCFPFFSLEVQYKAAQHYASFIWLNNWIVTSIHKIRKHINPINLPSPSPGLEFFKPPLFALLCLFFTFGVSRLELLIPNLGNIGERSGRVRGWSGITEEEIKIVNSN